MPTKLISLSKEQQGRWIVIDEPFIARRETYRIYNTLNNLIIKYFGRQDAEELRGNFKLKQIDPDALIELERLDGSRGYFFVQSNQQRRLINSESIVNDEERRFRKDGKKIIRKFVDYEEDMAGVYWRI
ncbi:hypothetical protein HYV50_04975 [Candidatus Pacearchaeota archaeon]|nr:hypothetical protein [Candidatus Pacearchaeota archaeon]